MASTNKTSKVSSVGSRLRTLEAMLPDAMARERFDAAREIGHIRYQVRKRRQVKRLAERLGEIEKRLRRSARTRAQRSENRPSWDPLENLPITAHQAAIVDAIETHPVVIVAGETGSGKTTQLPKFCLAAGRGAGGLIGCTQPRRIAATTVAQRIADELGEPLGASVGYKIRFQDRTRRESFIKVMTDGILLAEAQGDPALTAYDTLIVDEAHERSLNIDFILGILKKLVQRRPDLKLIVTSATIDTEKFARAFDDAPVIEVSGRMFPVEVRYRPIEAAEEGGDEGYVEAAVAAVESLTRESARGDVLVFMPTEQDIRETCELLTARRLPKSVVMPLYARLSAADQHRVFAGTGARKIIVATNVAETSITIPGIRYVVDTGLARIPRYSPRTRTTALPVAPIARSSADQRKGRCGRVENGICIRLYEEANYQARPRFTPPEILRANLAEVILRMISLKLGDIGAFPFIDPPDPRSIRDGLNLLSELGAIERDANRSHRKGIERYRLTERGRVMARMPIDPRLSRMLIEGRQQGCLPQLLVLAAALSIQDPRERPVEKEPAADQAHAAFKDPASDFVTLLNIWTRARGIVRSGALKRFCREHFLSFRRMREWRDIHRQLKTIATEAGLADDAGQTPTAAADSRDEEFGALYTAIHIAVLSGFLTNIAQRREKNIYRAARGRECMLFPGSGLFNRAGEWIVAAEMVLTSRLFARTAANIDSAWLESLAGPQCRYTHLAPRWSRKRGQVVADEQVSLYGLVIVVGRRVAYGRIAPEEAAEIFVRSALIEGDVRQSLPFMDHNQALIDDVTDMENRLRRRGLLVDEEILCQFYRDRLGTIADMRSLARRIKKEGGDGFLRLTPEDLLQAEPDADELALYPEEIKLGRARLKADYRFNPGGEDDGITVAVPAARAHQVEPADADWLVPGLLEEKITALLKTLPKRFRRSLAPVSDAAAVIASEMPRGGGDLLTALGDFIHRRFRVDIPATAWSEADLPAHLRMRFALKGAEGEILAVDRDAHVLQATAPAPPREAVLADLRRRWERDGINAWDFGDLPAAVAAESKEEPDYALFPALTRPVDGIRGVGLRLYATHEEALEKHRDGVAALLEIVLADDLRRLKRQLRLPPETARRVRFAGGHQALERQLFDRVVRDHLHRDLRTADAFSAHAAAVRRQLVTDGQALIAAAAPVVAAYDEVREVLFGLERQVGGRGAVAEFLLDRREDIHKLVPENFVSLYDRERLAHLPRYLQAVALRARRALQQFDRDRPKAEAVGRFEARLQRLLEELTPRTSAAKREALEELFWLIEEYKVSIFAQELKTAVPVSAKRLEKKIDAIGRIL
ncbi:MAG: ATP-dependent RNA helicase HrpA [Desulfobacterales bacterium]|nr:ATP-dependent RNA helicase HrpA [Desulfobacterales bacterium]